MCSRKAKKEAVSVVEKNNSKKKKLVKQSKVNGKAHIKMMAQ
jgi:hypothetical protein